MGAFECHACGTPFTHKRCTVCGELLPISAFTIQRDRRRAHARPRAACSDCERVTARVRRLPEEEPLRLYTEKEVGVYRGGTWRPRQDGAA